MPDALVVAGLAMRDAWARTHRPRVPEPMVIEEEDAVDRYSEGGATLPAMRNVYDFSARALSALVPTGGRVLDLGMGPGNALAYFLQRRPDVTAVGVDLSEGMLGRARERLGSAGLSDRVRLLQADICDLPAEAYADGVDAVCSVWTLHQLPDPATLAAALDSVAAVRGECGAAVWLLDFQRLCRPDAFRALLAATDPDYPVSLREDAIASEAAAFTATELREQLVRAGLGTAIHRTTRPLRMMQAAWLAGRRDPADSRGDWIELPVDDETERRAALLRRAFGTSLAAPLPRGAPAGGGAARRAEH